MENTYSRMDKRNSLIALLIGIVLFGFSVFQNINYMSVFGLKKSVQAESSTLATDVPVRLEIPKLNIDTEIIAVGLNDNGEMEVPKKQTQVGWYNGGQEPGSVGTAVLVGHYGVWRNGEPGVFNDLNKIKKGDEIIVRNAKGKTIVFSVRESRDYAWNGNTAVVFNSNDLKSHLNLITCDGTWNDATKSYSLRRVVFADKIG